MMQPLVDDRIVGGFTYAHHLLCTARETRGTTVVTIGLLHAQTRRTRWISPRAMTMSDGCLDVSMQQESGDVAYEGAYGHEGCGLGGGGAVA